MIGAAPAPPLMKRSQLLIIVLFLIVVGAGVFWFVRQKGGITSGTAAGANAAANPSATAKPAVEVPLIKAIQEGRVDDAKALLAKGNDANAANGEGMTALMQASEGSAYLPDNAAAITMLLDKGAKVDAQDTLGRTALYRAAAARQEPAMRILLARKANPNQPAANGSTPLLEAVTYGCMPCVQLLLSSGADVDQADTQKGTPLMIAAEGTAYMPNNMPLVTALLDKGAKVDALDVNGQTPLLRAAAAGKAEAVKLLLEKKANPNQKSNGGQTPLMEAIGHGYMPVIETLLKMGADVDLADTQGSSPLMIASEGNAYMPNNAPMVASLLTANPKVDAQDANGRTALSRAAGEGKTEAMALLLDHKANPNLKANNGTTPLHHAAAGKLDAAKLLLDRGADVNLADANGATPLMVAAEITPAPEQMIQLMLAHSARLDAVDGSGRTAQARAAANNNTAAVEQLKKGK